MTDSTFSQRVCFNGLFCVLSLIICQQGMYILYICLSMNTRLLNNIMCTCFAGNFTRQVRINDFLE